MRQISACTLVALLALFSLTQAQAAAAPDCRAKILRPVTDDMKISWKKGQTVPVDISRTTPEGESFCSHGGSCLPRIVKGQEAVRLINCRPGPSIGDGDHRLVASPEAHH
ncbi:MAG: hypothetical protein GAK28_00547 [Luteibacter sp.]|nr:MAG: hypothetical protein GAK28_00547 [Luteibacter sp.]